MAGGNSSGTAARSGHGRRRLSSSGADSYASSSGDYYTHPSPESDGPTPGDIGIVPVLPSFPSPVSPAPAPGVDMSAVTTTTERFEQVSSSVQTTTATTTTTTDTTTTTTEEIDPRCITTRHGVPCEGGGQCAVDETSGWPFCWTSMWDWVRACVRVGFFIRGTVAPRLRLRWLAHATFRCQRACLRLD